MNGTGMRQHTSSSLTPEENDEPSADPFIVQERIFAKYAAMLYTSDNGKNTDIHAHDCTISYYGFGIWNMHSYLKV